MLTVLETLRDYYAASNKDDLPGMAAFFVRTEWTESQVIAVLAWHPAETVLHVDR
jgi:hypothetical protein